MSYPKIKPCPQCSSSSDLDVYSYDNGWRHVECDKCFYLGPGEGSIRAAIKSHNEKCTPPVPRAGLVVSEEGGRT